MNVNSKIIEKLEETLANTLVAADFMEGRKPWKKDIIDTVRKLRLIRELNKKYYIAITGTQGAGKTRLLRALYDLDTTWLSDNPGRGEKVPVFVIEKEIQQPCGTVVKLDANGRTTEYEVEAREFQKIITSWGDTESNLFPILYVPKRHFPTNECGFVLLPGFEQKSDHNRAWQLLMEYVLQHAIGSVIVTDQTRLAEHSQDSVKDAVMNGRAPGGKPVIAISRTENADTPTREALRQRATERFCVNEEEAARIVCTGTGREYEEEWIPQLLNSLQIYVPAGQESKEARLNMLDDLVDGEVDLILDGIREALRERHLQSSLSPEIQIRDDIITEFRDARTSYRSRYEKSLRNHTKAHANKVKEIARDKYIREEEGFKNGVRKIGRWIGTTSGEREDQRIKRIADSWVNLPTSPQAGGAPGIALIQSDWRALGEQSSYTLKTAAPEPLTEKSGNTEVLLGYDRLDTESSPSRLLADEETQDELRKIFDPRHELDNVRPLANTKLKSTIKLVPALAMEYLRINQSLVLAHRDRLPSSSTTRPIGQFMTELAQDMDSAQLTGKTILKTIAAILAVDVAIDGSVDTIPGLLHAIFGGASASTAATAGTVAAGTTVSSATVATSVNAGTATAMSLGATLSMAAAGVIVAGVIGYKVTQHVQELDAANRSYINLVINEYAEAHVQNCLEIYDDAMDSLEERMRDNLDRAYGLGQSLGQQDNLLRAIEVAKRARLTLMGDLRVKQLLA
ncbi:MAG: hypothetical protein ACREP4_13325 [Stenotrophomonas sp.]|uniref:hypothetical protein n=1 Tax=Stenotrophomonas sp. TaxID=69392 RepID=UPI003D6D3888